MAAASLASFILLQSVQHLVTAQKICRDHAPRADATAPPFGQ